MVNSAVLTCPFCLRQSIQGHPGGPLRIAHIANCLDYEADSQTQAHDAATWAERGTHVRRMRPHEVLLLLANGIDVPTDTLPGEDVSHLVGTVEVSGSLAGTLRRKVIGVNL